MLASQIKQDKEVTLLVVECESMHLHLNQHGLLFFVAVLVLNCILLDVRHEVQAIMQWCALLFPDARRLWFTYVLIQRLLVYALVHDVLQRVHLGLVVRILR